MQRLTPAQFRAIARDRGYGRKDLAIVWNVTPTRITQITNDPNRPPHYDYALWGLPAKRVAPLVMGRRLAFALTLAPETASDSAARPIEIASATDDSTIEPGDIWVVRESPGVHLPEGCQAEVTAVGNVEGVLSVSFLFETGEAVTYPVNYLNGFECFLSATGRRGGLKSK